MVSIPVGHVDKAIKLQYFLIPRAESVHPVTEDNFPHKQSKKKKTSDSTGGVTLP